VDSDLKKVALVTGGSRGIGKAISLRLARDGFVVVVNYLKNEAAASSVREMILREGCPEAMLLQADVTKVDDAKQLLRIIEKKYGGLSVLVNNAGAVGGRLFLLSKNDDWWSEFHMNIAGTVNCTRFAAPIMIAQHSGVMINLTSISGLHGAPGQTAYSASKAAIIGFSKAIARELARYGISVNCVAPGFIDTDMIRSLPQELIQKRTEILPLGRIGTPDEVAELVSFLAGGRAQYIFGQVLAIDGGATM
jgi:3-oxoacyl-[acyl-carrier protein] reductase